MNQIFDNQIRSAIFKYGDDHIDIIMENNNVYGVYHSSADSFGVTDTFSLEEVGGLETVNKYAAEFEQLGICEN